VPNLARPDRQVHRPRVREAFAGWQPVFAEHGIATFPLISSGPDPEAKKPAIRSYQKVGLPGSRELASNPRFATRGAFGFMTGRTNAVAIIDVDVADERVLEDAIRRHGETPLVVRTAAGKFHVYYRYAGERRAIRPWSDLKIDLLGERGFVVAPKSKLSVGRYAIISGKLDDLDRLPVMRLPLAVASNGRSLYLNDTRRPLDDNPLRGMREGDGRNPALFTKIGPLAREVHAAGGSVTKLLELALGLNAECHQPMSHQEVGRIVENVWRMTLEGRNHIGRRDVGMVEQAVIDDLVLTRNSDAVILYTLLKAHQGRHAQFWITNGMAGKWFGWKPERLARARNCLLQRGYIKQIKPAWSHSPAKFVWV